MLEMIFRKKIVMRSLKVGLIVGTALNIINQGDAIFGDAQFDIFKAVMTYLVPYCVSTYVAVSSLREETTLKTPVTNPEG